MRDDSDHEHVSGCICHLNELAQVTYLSLLVDGRGDEAESLRTRGEWPTDRRLSA